MDLNAEINVVSLIDVMMLLMVIFMITAPMMQGGVDISLPRAEARPLDPKSGLVVTIDKAGAIHVDETVLTFSEFRSTFRALAANRGQDGVYLRADQGVPYGTVVKVLAVMRASGTADVGLVAEQEGGAVGVRRSENAHLKGPMGVSLALHLSLVALVLLLGLRKDDVPALPPIYRVNIVAAPAGPRAIGEVQPEPEVTPPVAPPTIAPPPPPSPTVERAVPITKAAQKQAPRTTPTETPARAAQKTPAPRAGGGPTGGQGTDVATVQTEGIDFPFPGYLNNIVRQIALRFNPSDGGSGLRAEVRFVIRRNGSVIGIGFITRSGNYAFDLEAQGAVEAAASQFGALPEGFPDDALPVVFSFDPRIIR